MSERVRRLPGRRLSVGLLAVETAVPRRENKTFTGLPLDDRLAGKGATARCAVQVIDLNRGDVVHELRIEGVVEELYDVAVLAGVQRPMAIGLKTDEIRRVLSLPPPT